MAVTVSTTAKRSWSDIVKGPTSLDSDTSSVESLGDVSTSDSVSPIAKCWNLRADEFVPSPAVKISSNLNLRADEFVLSSVAKVTSNLNIQAPKFVPLQKSPNMVSAYPWLADIDRKVSTMNVDAKAFTPSTLNACAKEFAPVDTGLSLAEFGQTVEGWTSFAKKMGKVFGGAAKELKTSRSSLNINSINPAFLSDDESDTETVIGLLDDIGNDADIESSVSIGNNESSESIVGSLDEFEGSDVEKESNEGDNESVVDESEPLFAFNSKAKEISDGNQESDRDTLFNESVLSWPHDKDSDFSSDVDPRARASSIDDSASLGGASSDLEVEDAMHISALQVRAPPGLSLPPWRLASGVSIAEASAKPWQVSSTPLKLPAWRRGTSSKSSSDSEGEDSPSLNVLVPPGLPPWRVARD